MIMKRLFLIIFVLLLQAEVFAQDLAAQAKQINYYYEQLEKQPLAPILQIKYIQSFPVDKYNFIELFNSHEEDLLAEHGADYVKKFRKLGKQFPDSVLPKSIMIAKDLPAWSAGPVDELQKGIYLVTHENPQLFVNIVRELKKDEQATLAKFLYAGAEGKNVNYDILVEILDRAAERKIKKIFIEAPLEETEK